jgi:hypothetical protein
MLTYAAAKAAEHEEKGGEEWGGELNTAILRYYQLVLGKTDKRVLVLTLLKAQKERGEKNYWQWQLERGAARTNPPAVKICRQDLGMLRYALSVWGMHAELCCCCCIWVASRRLT